MKKYFLAFFLGSVFLISTPASAENRAVNIYIGSIGVAIDNNAIQSVRKTVGNAITAGVVDSFIVSSPKVGGPVLKEGGLTACVEEGYSANAKQFDRFVSTIGATRHNSGTVINVEMALSCAPACQRRPVAALLVQRVQGRKFALIFRQINVM